MRSALLWPGYPFREGKALLAWTRSDFMRLRLWTLCGTRSPPALAWAWAFALGWLIGPQHEIWAQPDTFPRTRLSGEIELARLVDLCAQRLGLKIEYDAKTVQGAKVTLRLGESVTDDELWALTNQLLATRGLTSVQPPGQEEVLSIVKLTDAASLARVEQVVPPETLAGFANVVVQVEHRSVKDVIEAMKPVLSKPGGTMTALGDDGRILLSALRPRIDQILWLLESFDLPGPETIIRVIPSRYVNATQLASSVTAAVTARNTMSIRKLAGKLSPQSGDESVVLVAPEPEVQTWLELLSQFDQRQAIETHSYAPRHFALDEVQQLIEQTARDLGPRGSGGQWRLVTNDLTGTLIVTATPSEHETIEALIQRLDAVPAEARRPVRVFAIRNRSVNEIVDVLTQLIEAGVLEGGAYEASGNRKATTPRQQTQRAVLPPGAEPMLPQAQAEPRKSGQRRPTRSSSITGEPSSLVLTADEGTNTLIATGDARRLAQLEQLIGQLDVRQPQVMIEAMVVSLTEGQTLDLGVELEKLQINGETLITLSSLFGLGAPGMAGALEGLALPGAGGGAGFTGVALSPGDFRTLVRALETINEGRSLNIPRVLVNNNQQATLDSVLQAPFLSTNASNTIATTSFGGTQDAGTTISVTPQIAAGDHLILEYSVSVSTFVGESSNPGLPPPRQQNNLQSIVTIPDGYTIVVGGMEIESTAEAISQIPLLGDIPLIGELFKNRSRSTTRSRFYVFIRANVLRHDGFEDLKYLSDRDVLVADVDDGWPVVEPRVIH